MEVARKTRGTSGSSLEVEDGVAEPAGRPDRRRILIRYGWMRDVEVLLWTTSSGKRLRLGGGRRRVWGFTDFPGLGVRMGGAYGMGMGHHGLGTRLSEIWGKLRKYPHRFELAALSA